MDSPQNSYLSSYVLAQETTHEAKEHDYFEFMDLKLLFWDQNYPFCLASYCKNSDLVQGNTWKQKIPIFFSS